MNALVSSRTTNVADCKDLVALQEIAFGDDSSSRVEIAKAGKIYKNQASAEDMRIQKDPFLLVDSVLGMYPGIYLLDASNVGPRRWRIS